MAAIGPAFGWRRAAQMLHRNPFDSAAQKAEPAWMDVDDILPRRADDPLAALARQDLDPLSVDELTARIAALEGEIARCRTRMQVAVNHRATAEGLFRR